MKTLLISILFCVSVTLQAQITTQKLEDTEVIVSIKLKQEILSGLVQQLIKEVSDIKTERKIHTKSAYPVIIGNTKYYKETPETFLLNNIDSLNQRVCALEKIVNRLYQKQQQDSIKYASEAWIREKERQGIYVEEVQPDTI